MTPPVEPKAIPRLLESITWSRIAEDLLLPSTYAGHSTLDLLRLHLLPYLIPIRSERALAFEANERPEFLKSITDRLNSAPSRATLWHFRRRHRVAFQHAVLRSLALIVIDSEENLASLPFVDDNTTIAATLPPRFDSFRDKRTLSNIDIYPRIYDGRRRFHNEQLPLFQGGPVRLNESPRTLLFESIGLPAVLIIDHGSQAATTAVLRNPDWMQNPYAPTDLGPVLGTDASRPYTACNILVTHKSEADLVLLSQRQIGSGAGTYAVPGGKKKDQESVRSCVVRELREETGLEFRCGYPVSRRRTAEPGYPEVISIGVVATDWVGDLQQNREYVHGRWTWYRLSEPPKPLFFPTRYLLEDYQFNPRPGLTWEDIEDPPSLPLWELA